MERTIATVLLSYISGEKKAKGCENLKTTSLTKLAAAIGVAQPTLTNLIRGERGFGEAVIDKVMAYYGLSIVQRK